MHERFLPARQRAGWRAAIALALSASLALGMAAPAQSAPKARQIGQEDAPRSCAETSGTAVFSPRLDTGRSAAANVRTAFGAATFWGIEENAAITQRGGRAALRITYPKGSTAPSMSKQPLGGAGFYAAHGEARPLQRACLAYRVRFDKTFDFVRGGKLPGLFGGAEPPSGGARPRGDDGFTLRLMWRSGGQGELYLYAPNMRPSSDDGGQQLGTGAFRFPRGRWVDVALEAVMNSRGKSDGTATLWIDGTPKIAVRGIRYRKSERIGVEGLMFSTFFGGKSKSFAPRRTQHAEFADFRIYSGKG